MFHPLAVAVVAEAGLTEDEPPRSRLTRFRDGIVSQWVDAVDESVLPDISPWVRMTALLDEVVVLIPELSKAT